MNVLFYMACGIGLLFVKTSLLMPFPFLSRIVDPALVLTVYLGLFRPEITYAAVAVFLGYLLDIFSGSRFGFHIILSSALYYGTSLMRGRFFLESTLFQSVYIAAMVLLHAAVGAAVFTLMGSESNASLLFDEIIWRMLANAALGAVLFRWMRRTEGRWAPLSERKPAGISLD